MKSLNRYALCGLLAAVLIAPVASQVRPAPSIQGASIEGATCIETKPGDYRIEFQAPSGTSVAIFASSHPDRIDSKEPLVQNATSPAEIHAGDGSERLYFYLKPKSGPSRVVAPRRLPLTSVANFRDLGGYRTVDGHYTKWGLMYRSGNLAKLSETDLAYLKPLNIRLVCDFRLDFERQPAPDKWSGEGAPEMLILPMDTYNNLPPGYEKDITIRMNAVYGRFPFESAPELKQALLRFANGDVPALVHCSAGKDRTGMFAAFLLTALGVPRETVMQDYLLTNQYMTPTSVNADWLNVAFQAISLKYSSFDDYLTKTVGLTESDLRNLRTRLLEQ